MVGKLAALALLSLAIAASAAAQSPPGGPRVAQTVLIEAGDSMPAALQKLAGAIKRGNTLAQQMNLQGNARLWAPIFAGPQSGLLLVTVDAPGLAALTADRAKQRASKEWQQMMAEAVAGLRVTSVSLLTAVPAAPPSMPRPPTASSGPARVLEVVTLEMGSNPTAAMTALLATMKTGDSIARKLGVASSVQLWAATFAGTNSGRLHVAVEHASLDSFAADTEKMGASAEWRKARDEAGAAGVRIVSQSLYEEVRP